MHSTATLKHRLTGMHSVGHIRVLGPDSTTQNNCQWAAGTAHSDLERKACVWWEVTPSAGQTARGMPSFLAGKPGGLEKWGIECKRDLDVSRVLEGTSKTGVRLSPEIVPSTPMKGLPYSYEKPSRDRWRL